MKRYKKRKSTNRLGIVSITAVVILMSVILSTQIIDLHAKNTTLHERKEKLQESLEEQQKRQSDLEEERIYVQTKQYVEDRAKDLGYIYPDEVIIKPNNE